MPRRSDHEFLSRYRRVRAALDPPYCFRCTTKRVSSRSESRAGEGGRRLQFFGGVSGEFFRLPAGIFDRVETREPRPQRFAAVIVRSGQQIEQFRPFAGGNPV